MMVTLKPASASITAVRRTRGTSSDDHDVAPLQEAAIGRRGSFDFVMMDSYVVVLFLSLGRLDNERRAPY